MSNDLNVLAIAVTGSVALVIAFVYYMPPLFGKLWANQVVQYAGLSDADLMPATPLAFFRMISLWLLTYIANALALAFALQITRTTDLLTAIGIAVVLGAGFGLTISSWPVIHAKQPVKLWLVNAGSYLLTLVIMAVVLIAWQ